MNKPEQPGSADPRKRRGAKAAAVVLAAVVLFGGGFLTAAMTADPTTSEEYAALDATGQRAATNRDAYKGQRDALQDQMTAAESEAQKKDDAVLLRESAVKKAEEEVKKRESAVTTVEKKQAANTIADGTWVVGVDIEAGTYKAKSSVGSSCYWAILTSGTNGDDIINNDIPGGGLPSVTLAAGQDFKSSRCGSWTKQ
jgi:apolipoprotein N-acyltransferase